jgi:carbonic anhydrase
MLKIVETNVIKLGQYQGTKLSPKAQSHLDYIKAKESDAVYKRQIEAFNRYMESAGLKVTDKTKDGTKCV